MKEIVISVICMCITLLSQAQNTHGSIRGKLLHAETNEAIPFTAVFVETGNGPHGTTTDERGIFHLKPLAPGEYDLKVESAFYRDFVLVGVRVQTGRATYVDDIMLREYTVDLPGFEFKEYINPLVDIDEPSKMVIRSADILERADARNTVSMVGSIIPGIKTTADGSGLHFRGSRPQNMATFIDGVKIGGGLVPRVPASAIRELTVYAGGIPASYGDVTGGVVIIETKGYLDFYREANR